MQLWFEEGKLLSLQKLSSIASAKAVLALHFVQI